MCGHREVGSAAGDGDRAAGKAPAPSVTGHGDRGPLSPLGFGAVMLSLGMLISIANGPSFAGYLARITVQLRAKTVTASTTITLLGATLGLVLAGLARYFDTSHSILQATVDHDYQH